MVLTGIWPLRHQPRARETVITVINSIIICRKGSGSCLEARFAPLLNINIVNIWSVRFGGFIIGDTTEHTIKRSCSQFKIDDVGLVS